MLMSTLAFLRGHPEPSLAQLLLAYLVRRDEHLRRTRPVIAHVISRPVDRDVTAGPGRRDTLGGDRGRGGGARERVDRGEGPRLELQAGFEPPAALVDVVVQKGGEPLSRVLGEQEVGLGEPPGLDPGLVEGSADVALLGAVLAVHHTIVSAKRTGARVGSKLTELLWRRMSLKWTALSTLRSAYLGTVTTATDSDTATGIMLWAEKDSNCVPVNTAGSPVNRCRAGGGVGVAWWVKTFGTARPTKFPSQCFSPALFR